MADISLKEYFENIKALLDRGEVDAVVHHCRHILRYYPKNVHAYRFLGQALLDHGNLKEAEEIFRRVLSVYPDDLVAHASLSIINERQDKGREAIWHLERVFEQNQGKPEVAERLKTLYRRYRQVDQVRLQLTAGAVARQYQRSGMHSQAIETLKSTLERAPGRTDLRLWLAKTFWESGMEVESAETALEVLKALPDCAEANELLTRLWLMEGRPSDAQRYLNRIEAVDPYLAYRIAKNVAPPDSAFRLPELDYGTIERKRIATEAPDWLGEINETQIEEDWMQDVSVATEEVDVTDGGLSSEIPADWLLEDSEDELSGEQIPDVMQEHTGFTGLLAALDEDEEAPPEFFAASEAEEVAGESIVVPDDFFDRMPQTLDESEDNFFTESFTMGEVAQSEDDSGTDDPFAWMQDHDDDIEIAEAGEGVAEPATGESDENDPLAWMHTSGIEITDTSNLFEQELLRDEGEMTFQDPEDVDPLAWMRTSGIEVEESEPPDFFSELPNTSALNVPEAETGITEEGDPMAWLQSSESESSPTSEDTAVQDDDSWMTDESMLDEMLDMEVLTQTGELTPPPSLKDILGSDIEEQVYIEPEGRIGPTEILPGNDELDVENTSDWQSEMSDQHDFPDWLDNDDSDSEEDSFEWLSQSGDEEAEGQSVEGTTESDPLDWMSDPALEETGSDSDLSWLSEEPGEIEEHAETPQWMAGITPDTPDIEASADELFKPINAADDNANEVAEPVSETSDWLVEAAPLLDETPQQESTPTGELEWLDSGEDDEETPVESLSETPDWLAGIAPVGEEAPIRDFEWAEDAGEAAEPVSETPDWLAEAAPLTDETPQEDMQGEQFEWLSSDEGEVAEPVSETPDWLAEAVPLTDETPQEDVQGEQVEWLSSDEGEAAEPVSETPDWLAEAAPLMDETPQEDVQGEQFEWLSSDEDEAAEPVSETPDWLTEIVSTSEEVPTRDFEWMEDESEAVEPVSETPDWLAEAAPLTDETPQEDVQGEQFQWTDAAFEPVDEEAEHLHEESLQAESRGGQFEWLDEEGSADAEVQGGEVAWSDEEEAEVSGEAEGAAFEWYRGEAGITTTPLTDSQWDEAEFDETDTSELESVAGDDVEESPVWLADALSEPVDPGDFEFETDATHSEFGWIDDQETAEADEIMAAEAEVEVETAAETDLGQAEQSDDEEKILATAPAPPPAQNAPDWLNEMVPGLDLDYGARDEPMEADFVEEGPVAQRTDNFHWLNDIVDEETSQFQPIREEVSKPQGRFVFKKLPTWLRRPAEKGQEQSSDADDDFELPDWLQ